MSSPPIRLSPGTLLLSVPQMLDPNFMHTVVLICDHTPEGAFGLVVNKEFGVTLDQLIPDHPVLCELELPVFEGGPVGRDTLQFLHRVPAEISGGVELADGLYMGGELGDLARYGADGIETGGNLRLYLGYSGWGAGQLEEELATGSWVPAPLRTEILFAGADQQATWRRAMRGLGGDWEGLAHQPPDPSWN
ncbi:MAG: YqgE/AlgH family protein [bacterium]|nr:YqgE/AlgH family protein [bacterium]